MDINDIKKGKQSAIIAYLSIIGTIIAFYINQEDKKTLFASFHIRQAFGTHIGFYTMGALVSIFDSWIISASFYIFIFLLWIYGLINAISASAKPIPIVGHYFQKWFTFIK